MVLQWKEFNIEVTIKHETELSQPVKQLFEKMGYEVKSEVLNCDLVAYRQDIPDPVIIELKKSLTVPLLLQGLKRQQLSPNIYLAVEKKKYKQKDWKWNVQLCQKLGVGLITVQFYKTLKPKVDVCCDPISNQTPTKQLKRQTVKLMKEFHARSGDYNIGGSTKRKIVTAYREHALYCAYLTKCKGIISPKELKRLTGLEQADKILQRNVYGWFERIERGKYVVTDAGKEALSVYKDIVAERFVNHPKTNHLYTE